MKIKEIIVEVKINIFQGIVYSNLINECNELINEVDNVINQNLDEYYSSSYYEKIMSWPRSQATVCKTVLGGSVTHTHFHF